MLKVCKKCNKELALEKFLSNRSYLCFDCKNDSIKQKKKQDKINKKKFRNKQTNEPDFWIRDKIGYWRTKYHVPSDLTSEYLIDLFKQQNGKCYYTGIEIFFGQRAGHALPNSASLDRKIPKLGYVRGNVAWCSYLVNTIKGALKEEQFYDHIKGIINKNDTLIKKIPSGNANIVIPLAGRGQRFVDAGYLRPKPLISVNDKPMIQRVVENINIPGKYIFLILEEHCNTYGIDSLFSSLCVDYEVVKVKSITEGAACTVLLAKDLINSDTPLLLANSDQIVEWSPEHFLSYIHGKNADGGILTFNANHPKWSYAKLAEGSNLVTEVAEKNPISYHATVGIYYFKRGKVFVNSAEQMISKNIRVNNEFYICPVFNELIGNGGNVYSYPVTEMHGLGTPEDLKNYLGK